MTVSKSAAAWKDVRAEMKPREVQEGKRGRMTVQYHTRLREHHDLSQEVGVILHDPNVDLLKLCLDLVFSNLIL